MTLPLLIPTIIFLGARDVAWSFQSTFVPALVITKGGPNFATLFLPLYIHENGFEYLRFGYASAMTVAMFSSHNLAGWRADRGPPTLAKAAGSLNIREGNHRSRVTLPRLNQIKKEERK